MLASFFVISRTRKYTSYIKNDSMDYFLHYSVAQNTTFKYQEFLTLIYSYVGIETIKLINTFYYALPISFCIGKGKRKYEFTRPRQNSEDDLLQSLYFYAGIFISFMFKQKVLYLFSFSYRADNHKLHIS